MRASIPERESLCTACRDSVCLPSCIFIGIPDIEQKMLMKIYSRDCTIFRQGEQASSVYVIRSGWIRETHLSNTGKIISKVLSPGDTLGVEAVLTGTCHKVTADSMVESELICMPDWQFVILLNKYPHLAMKLLKRTSLKLQLALEDFFDVAGKKPSSQRLWKSLQRRAQYCGHSGKDGVKLSLPFSIQDMADEIGCTRQWASKLFSQLEAQGIARRKGHWITLLKRESGKPLSGKTGSRKEFHVIPAIGS
jgi:CRP/FNR family cyclic AMP-dependent transcriptional regulator